MVLSLEMCTECKWRPEPAAALQRIVYMFGAMGMLSSDRVISLFSGAGGCSLGFAAAGAKPTVAADIDADACETYRRNLEVECDELDLSSDAAVARIMGRAGPTAPFAIVGGPPCQGFSTAGPRNASDPRNRLIFNYLEILRRLQPRWFLFENVEGILTSNGGRDIVRLATELRAMGYAFQLEKVNFAGYGLPQTRKRVLVVGNRLGHRFELPAPEFSFDSGKAKSYSRLPSAPSLLDSIRDLPAPGTLDRPLPYDDGTPSPFATTLRAASGMVSQHFVPKRSDAAAVARHLLPGQTMKDLPEELQHESWRKRANRRVSDGTPTEKRGGAPAGFKRLKGELNALTITSAAPREFIHPTDDRTLTLRECARLQSFPDEFTFAGKAVSVARQIGNAIPPLAGRVLAEMLMREDGRAGGGSGLRHGVSPGLFGFHLTDAGAMSPALAQTASALQALMDQDHELPLARAINKGQPLLDLMNQDRELPLAGVING